MNIDKPNPKRLGALLSTWPWPRANPPLWVVAALEYNGYTTLSADQWGVAIGLEPVGSRPLGPDETTKQIPETAAPFFKQLDRAIETLAMDQIEKWLSEEGHTETNPNTVLSRMRALWRADPVLAPKRTEDEAPRIKVIDASEGSSISDYEAFIPGSLGDGLRKAPKLAWYVPYTTPEAGLIAAGAVWDLPEEVGNHEGCMILGPKPEHINAAEGQSRRQPKEMIARTSAAVAKITEQILDECVGPPHPKDSHVHRMR